MQRSKMMLAALLGAVMAVGTVANAQQDPGNAGNNNGGNNNGGGMRRGGGGPGGDPAQWRQRMMDNIKEQLQAKDDEWQVLQPKIEKVSNAQRDMRAGGMFGRGGRGPGGNNGGNGGGNGGGNNGQPESDVSRARAALQQTLDNTGASADDINTKLQAFRDARNKAADDLKTAQTDLKSMLTARQEAVLVNMGMLD